MIVTNCTDCPCLCEYHDESYCKLDYETSLQWTNAKKPATCYCSEDCNLVELITTEKHIIPEEIEIRQGEVPKHKRGRGYYWPN